MATTKKKRAPRKKKATRKAKPEEPELTPEQQERLEAVQAYAIETSITESHIEVILMMIAEGKTKTEACEVMGVPMRWFHKSLQNDLWGLRKRLAEAEALQAGTMLDETWGAIRKLPEGEVASVRVMAEHARWNASKADPSRYGDRKILQTAEETELQPLRVAVPYTDLNE